MKKSIKGGIIFITTLMAFFLVASSFGSCTKDPELIGIENFEIIQQKGDSLEVKITALINNPNRITANVSKVDAKVFINGVFCGIVDHHEKVKLKAKKTTSVSMISNISIEQFSTMFPVLMEEDSSLVEIKGKFQINLGVAKINLKRDLKKKMNLSGVIEEQIQKSLAENGIAIRKIWPTNVTFGSSDWEIDIKIFNDFGIDYLLDSIKANINLVNNDSDFGKVVFTDSQLIKKKSSHTISSEVEINNVKIFSQMVSSIFGKKEVTVAGHAWVRLGKHKFKVPFTQNIGLSSM